MQAFFLVSAIFLALILYHFCLYLSIFRALRVVEETLIIVGDSLTSDIKGANNAGIACCWYDPERKPAPSELRIDHIITNLNQIHDII